MLAVKFWVKGDRRFLWKGLGVDSSTLFGAFSNALLLMYGEEGLKDFFSAYKEGRLVFSSLFPLVKGVKGDVFFLPKPILGTSVVKDSISDRKKVKKVKWLSLRLFGKFMEGVKFENGDYLSDFNLVGEDVKIHGSFAFFKDEVDEGVLDKYEVVEVPHVSKDRLNAPTEGNLFYAFELQLSEGLGFCALADGCEEWDCNRLKAVFRLLADEGIGGDRSVGKGQFDEVEFDELDVFLPEGKGFVNLSVVYPSEDELDAIYTLSLKKKDGFVFRGRGGPLKKSPLRMISEGCFFSRKVAGRVVEEGFVLRNGKALMVSGVRV